MSNSLDHIKGFGVSMQLLRDLREATTMLVLYAVTTERHTHLRSLADELGMTVQGASDYVRRMIGHGLLQRVDGEYRATKKGVEVLLGRFLELRSFVDRASRATRPRCGPSPSGRAGGGGGAGNRGGEREARG